MPAVGIADWGGSFIKYLPGYIRVLNRATRLRQIPLGKMKWSGSKLVKKIEMGMNTAYTSGVDGGAIPPAGKGTFVEAEGYRKFNYGSVAITDGLMYNAGDTENSCVAVTSYYLKSMLEVAKRYENFMMARDGTGVVATLGATASGATFTVSDGRMFLPGKDYEIRSATTPYPVITTFTVRSVARSLTAANEATITPAATLAASGQATGDLIVWGTGQYSAFNRCITGLQALIDDAGGTFQGVNCTTYPWYTSPIIDGGGTAFSMTPAIVRQMQAMLKQEQEDFEVPGGLLVYTSVWDGLTIETMYENVVRLTPDSQSVGLPGGMTFKSALGTVTFLTDHAMPYGQVEFINRAKISRPVQKELDWRRSEGGGIFERNDRAGYYTATTIEISDLFIEERNACGRIENLNVTPYSAY